MKKPFHPSEAKPADAVTNARIATQLACGAVSGAVSKTLTAPLERVKIVRQVGSTAADARLPRSIWGTLAHLVREGGVRSLWFGNGANVARVVPVYGLKFGLNDTFNVLASRALAARGGGSDAVFLRTMLAGTAAGLTQALVTYPLEVVRTRLTLGPGFVEARNGILGCAREIVRKEGMCALYKGIAPTLVSGAPYAGLQMSSYALLKERAPVDPETGKTELVWALPAGALSGIIAQTLTYPGDTVRRCMQINGLGGGARRYRNSWECMRSIWRNKGARGFFNGLGANTVRAVPGTAIQFFVYEHMKRSLGL